MEPSADQELRRKRQQSQPSASRTDSTPGVITRRHYHRKEVGSFVRSQEVLRQDTALNKDGVKVV